VNLHLRRKTKHKNDLDSDEDENYTLLAPPRRLTQQARETLAFCLAAGLIAALVWGVYRWTNASRYAPPLYNGTTTLRP
jgi:hypothetical protein